MSSFAAPSSAAPRVPLPEGPLFAAVVESCREALARDGAAAAVDSDAVRAWAASAPLDEIAADSGRFGFPLRFGSQTEEINFAAALQLVLANSGFDREIRAEKGRGAAMATSFGAMGLHLGGAIDAEAMVGATLHRVSELFDLPVDRDVEVVPAVYRTEAHPLRAAAEKVRRLLNETGSTLRGLGCRDMAAAVLPALPAEGSGARGSAEALVRRLVSRVRAFDDRGAGGTLLLGRAQLLAADLRRRFGGNDPRFDYEDAAAVGVAPGAALVAVARRLGLVRVRSPDLEAALARGKNLEAGGEWETSLRAAAVVACDEALRALRAREGGEGVLGTQLDDYLVGLDKDGFLDGCPPHVCRETVFY